MERGEYPPPASQGSLESVIADGGDRQLDRILEGLSRPRARGVLYALANEEPQSLDEITSAVVNQEAIPRSDTEQAQAVKTELYHSTLPKLADLGLIEYDERSETVCFRDPPQEMKEFLKLSRQLDTEN